MLVADPVPAGLTDLQGAGTTWQGYGIYLRFRASSLSAAGLASPPYEPADCAEVMRYLELPQNLTSEFSPVWAPTTGPDATCQAAYELENEWTKLGSHRVMYSGGWVHFVGMGS